MSPEQAHDDELDARSDLFSLGTLLFHLASGHLPFSGSNPSIVLKNIIEGNRPDLSEICPSLSATFIEVVERLLQTDRDERLSTAQEVERLLVEALREVGLEADDPTWGIVAWLRDPAEYKTKLDQHLRTTLLSQGRQRLHQGDALAALRLLNRLLAIDENNEEVLELVQSLHMEPVNKRSKTPWLVVGMAGLAATAFITLTLLAGPAREPDLRNGATQTTASTEAESDSSPAPSIVEPTPPPVDPATEPTTDAVADTQLHTDPSSTPVDDRPNTRAFQAVRREIAPSVPRAPTQTTTPAPVFEDEGCLEVRTRNSWAFIWIDGEPTGRKTTSPDCMPVKAGTHTVLLSGSPFAADVEFTVTVAAGERKRVQPLLPLRPIRVHFDARYADSCVLAVDGRERGSLIDLERSLELERAAGLSHRLSLRCDDETWLSTVSADANPDLSFDGRKAP
jgi:serine/threonine protein kinase